MTDEWYIPLGVERRSGRVKRWFIALDVQELNYSVQKHIHVVPRNDQYNRIMNWRTRR